MIAFAVTDPDELVKNFLWLAEQESARRWRLRAAIGDDEVLSAANFALFNAALKFNPRWQGEDGFEAYARKAIHNRFKDCARDGATRDWRTVPLNDDVPIEDRAPDDADEVRTALAKIDAAQAKLLSDSFGIGAAPMSHQEIAERDGVCQSTVKNRLALAKQELAQQILRERSRHGD